MRSIKYLFLIAILSMFAFSMANVLADQDSSSIEDEKEVEDESEIENENEIEDENETESEMENEGILVENTPVTRSEAISIAQSEFPGAVLEVEQEYEHGALVWQVKLYDRITDKVYEVKVDAQSGDIVDRDAGSEDSGDDIGDDVDNGIDDDNSSDDNVFENIIENTTISGQSAIDLAKTYAQGEVRKVEQEYENGVLVWKVEIVDGNTKISIYINAQTGELVKINQDEVTSQESETQQASDDGRLEEIENRVGQIEERMTFFERILKAFGFGN